jgi:hypothetical protein
MTVAQQGRPIAVRLASLPPLLAAFVRLFWTGDFDRHGSAPVLWQRGYESAMALAKQKSFCIAIG